MLSLIPRPADGNLQSVFDHVATKLYEQGIPCMNEDGTGCAYKHGDLHCAIGWLLPSYSPSYECTNVEDLIEGGVFGKVGEPMYSLLADLQHAHDTVATDQLLTDPNTASSFREALCPFLEAIAARYKLSTELVFNLYQRH